MDREIAKFGENANNDAHHCKCHVDFSSKTDE